MTAPATEFLYLGQEDVVAAGGTDLPAMVDVLERAFRINAAGQVRMPPPGASLRRRIEPPVWE